MFDDTTTEFLITLAFAIVHAAIWFMAGYVYRNIQLTREIRQMLENVGGLKIKFVDENGQEITNNAQSEIKPVLTLKHEIHDGGHYFFYEDDTFACQGATLEAQPSSIRPAVKINRWPNLSMLKVNRPITLSRDNWRQSSEVPA